MTYSVPVSELEFHSLPEPFFFERELTIWQAFTVYSMVHMTYSLHLPLPPQMIVVDQSGNTTCTVTPINMVQLDF